MTLGLPIGTWILMAAAIVPGLALVTMAYRIHGPADRKRRPAPPPSGADGTDG